MTTSIRGPYKDKWDYERHEFKSFDPMCEPGLISICFLSCGKHKLTKVCLDSTLKAAALYKGEIEFLFLEQGDDKMETDANVKYFESLNLERKIIIRPNRNYGINAAWNNLLSIARGEYVMLHENDFFNIAPEFDFLQKAKDIFSENNNVDIIRFRDPRDPCENWGHRKPIYDPFSCSDAELAKTNIRVYEEMTSEGLIYLVSKFPNGWNHNPNIVRKRLLRQILPLPEPPFGSDPRHSETPTQQKVAMIGCETAQGGNFYHHAGGSARQFYENKEALC